MIKKDFLQMIEEEFEDFENEKARRRNIKMIVDFDSDSANITHAGKDFIVLMPKLKPKFKSSVYIKKDNKKGNSLF